jgi:hypothetical protein
MRVLLVPLCLAAMAAGCEHEHLPPAHERFYVVDDKMALVDRTAIVGVIQDHYTNRAMPGEPIQVVVSDDLRHRCVFSIVVPEKPPGNSRLRDPEAKRQFGRLVQWMRSEGTGDPGQLGLGGLPATVNSLKLSALPSRIVIAKGDPVYDEPGSGAGWSFREGVVANDACLSSDAFPLKTDPFNEPAEINFWLPETVGVSPDHERAVMRFWALWASAHNAELRRATPELISALDFSVAAFSEVRRNEKEGDPGMRVVTRLTEQEPKPEPEPEQVTVTAPHTTRKTVTPPPPPRDTREGDLWDLGRECVGNVFVVDHSPSMVGDIGPDGKLEVIPERQAGFDDLRAKLCVLLRDIPCEWLNVAVFSGMPGKERADTASPEMLAATAENRARLMDWLGKQQLGLGSAMLPAIERALSWENVDVITLVADGQPTGIGEQEAILARLQEVRRVRPLRVNVIAVGNLEKSRELRERLAFPGLEFLQRVADLTGGVLVRW